jgi:hypothetical protein
MVDKKKSKTKKKVIKKEEIIENDFTKNAECTRLLTKMINLLPIKDNKLKSSSGKDKILEKK